MSFFKHEQEIPEEFKQKLDEALSAVSAGDYQKAIKNCKDILTEVTKNSEVWLCYIHALLGAGKKDDAKKAFQNAKKQLKKEDYMLDMGSPQTLVELAIILEEENQAKTAKRIYEELTLKSPKFYKPWFLLASMYKKQNDLEKAEQVFREGISKSEGEAERLLVGLAEVLTLQHRFEEGLEVRRQATQVNPNFVEAWFSFAVDSFQFGDYDEAEEALQKAKNLSKDDIAMMDTIKQTVKMLEDHLKKCPEGMDEGVYMFSVGVVHYQNQDFERTRKAMERAVRLRPKHAESWTVLAGALAQLKELKEAEKACKIAISLDPKSVAAYQVLSSIRALQGDMNAAIEVLNDGITSNPDDPTLRKLLLEAQKVRGGDQLLSKELSEAEEHKIEAMNLLTEGKLEKALKMFQKVVKLNPEDADAWAQLGLIYVNLKKLDAGEKAAREAIKLEDNNAIAWGVLGAALGDAGKLEEAEKALTRAVELDPNNASNVLPLGFIYMQRGNLDMAQIMLEKAVKLRPKVPVVWQMLSQVYKLQGKDSEAANALANAQRYGLQ